MPGRTLQLFLLISINYQNPLLTVLWTSSLQHDQNFVWMQVMISVHFRHFPFIQLLGFSFSIVIRDPIFDNCNDAMQK